MAPSARISPVFVCVCAHVFPYSIFLNPLLKKMHPMENLFGYSTTNFGQLSRRKPDSPYLNHCGFIDFRHEGHLEPRSLLGSPSFMLPYIDSSPLPPPPPTHTHTHTHFHTSMLCISTGNPASEYINDLYIKSLRIS